jgi:hypothetical protein
MSLVAARYSYSRDSNSLHSSVLPTLRCGLMMLSSSRGCVDTVM